MAPAIPFFDIGAADLIERLQEAALNEARNEEAVEAGHISASAAGKVQRELLGQLLVSSAELSELDGHILAVCLHLGGKGGNDLLLDPFRHAAVDAADDAAAGDVEFRRRHGLARQRNHRRSAQQQKTYALAHVNSSRIGPLPDKLVRCIRTAGTLLPACLASPGP